MSTNTRAPKKTVPATRLIGLDLPGTAAAFKVCIITEEGNEKGSNAVTVERPE